MSPVSRLGFSAGALLLAVPLALLLGENGLDSPIYLLAGQADTPTGAIIWQLRLPRVLAAMGVGGLLAIAGVVAQNLFKNPLADPYVLGVSSGAALSYLLTITFGLALPAVLTSFIGAMVAMTVLLAVSWRHFRHIERVLLNGVMLSFGLSALISIILVLSKQHQTQSLLFWLMGDLSHAPVRWWPLIVLVLALAALGWRWRELDVLSRGNRFAEKTGVAAAPFNLGLLLCTALLVAVAVSLAGPIGFVGLMVPHLTRYQLGFSHRLLLPGAAINGAVLLLSADTLARVVAAPVQLPAGAITAVLGVFFFLFLQYRGATW